MSYDLRLCDRDGKALELDEPHELRGGTYALGGTTELWLNVTYNYWRHFESMGPEGLRTLYGKTGAESIPVLEACMALLGDDVSDDYWSATEGNARSALRSLLTMARLRPDGVWQGD